jgi:hypothetical protein
MHIDKVAQRKMDLLWVALCSFLPLGCESLDCREKEMLLSLLMLWLGVGVGALLMRREFSFRLPVLFAFELSRLGGCLSMRWANIFILF